MSPWVERTAVHADLVSSPPSVPVGGRAGHSLNSRVHRGWKQAFPIRCGTGHSQMPYLAVSSAEPAAAFASSWPSLPLVFYHNSFSPPLFQLWCRNHQTQAFPHVHALLCRTARAWSPGQENQEGLRHKADSGIELLRGKLC